MLMPGRHYSATSAYRYGFNGQEHDRELNENITTVEFWEYDARLGRRWNVDIRPNSGISIYAVFGNNPMLNIDSKGDTLTVSNDIDSHTDIFEQVKDEEKKYLCFNEDGTLNFDRKTFNKDHHISDADAAFGFSIIASLGLQNLVDIIDADENLFYQGNDLLPEAILDYQTKALTSVNMTNITMFPQGQVFPGSVSIPQANGQNAIVNVGAYAFYRNLSVSTRGDEGTPTHPDLNFSIPGTFNPRTGKIYDGTLSILPGRSIFGFPDFSGNAFQIPRASLVYHELRENFYRTIMGFLYAPAHAASIFDENSSPNKNWINSNPGILLQGKTFILKK